MPRAWPLLLVLVAVLAGGVFLLTRPGDDPYAVDEAGRRGAEPFEAPSLRGHPVEGAPGGPRGGREADGTSGGEEVPDVPEVAPEVLLHGTVRARARDEPVANAHVWIEEHREPCPGLPAWGPRTIYDDDGAGAGAILHGATRQGTTTGKDGRFVLRALPTEIPVSGAVDLYVAAPGYVAEVRCAVAIPSEVDVDLEAGLRILGVVKTTDGRLVTGASVRARPAPETPLEPGHATLFGVTTGEDGRFDLGGLRPGDVLLDVVAPRCMPLTSLPVDPAEGREVTLVVTPAYAVSLRLRTADDGPLVHPTLLWRTTEAAPRSEVVLLDLHDEARAADGTWSTAPVLLPCDGRGAVLQVKADGYATWTSPTLELPPEGGETTIDVTLPSDYLSGSLRVRLEDEAGQPVSVAGAGTWVGIARLDPGTRPSSYVLEQAEDLHVTSLPAGSYRLMLRSAAFAPVEQDVVITAGHMEEQLVRVRPPGKLRVRFYAPERTRVAFQLLQGGQVVQAFPEGAAVTDADGGQVLSAGSDGVLLSGLATGSYVVQVVSEELTAPPRTVSVVEGDTEEVEITVAFR